MVRGWANGHAWPLPQHGHHVQHGEQPYIQRDKLVHYELRTQAGAWRMSVSAIWVQWADIPQPWASAKGMEVRGVWVEKAALQVKVVCWVERQRRLAVTSSSSYSKSSGIKAGNSEVRRVPGNGFSSCAAPTFSCVQGILNGGRNRFPECTGTESVPERFRVRVRRREKRRFRVRIVRRCAECAR